MRKIVAALVLMLIASPAFSEDPSIMGPFQAAQRMRMERLAAAAPHAKHTTQVSAPTTTSPVPVQGTKQISKTAAQQNPILVIQQFTVADLEAVLEDARAQTPPDTIAANCYQALIPIVQTGVGNLLPSGAPSGLGGFQFLQKTRDVKSRIASLQSNTGPLASLNAACAPLVVDTENTLIQLGIVSGGVAASGGLTLPTVLPFLPKF